MITNNKEPATGTTAPPSLPSTQAATVRPLVARPYSQLLLTVEPDYFVLQPHIPASTDAKSVVSRPSSDLVRILFKTNDIISKEETLEQMNEKLAEEANEAEVRKHPTKGPIDLSAMAEENPRRVSFISADSYMRSDSAKDYIIYGCIGLLNLYTGPHFIVITSVKSLGDIEDKPVFAINKVAVLPMDPHEAVSILDRLAQQYDCSLGPLLNIEQATKQAAMRQLETNLDTVDVQLVSPAPVKSPKFRLSFLGIKPDRDQQSTTSSSHNSPGQLIQTNQGSDINIAPGKNKRITFDIPGSVSANALSKNEDIEKNKALSQEKLPAPPSSPPLSPTRSSPGFLSKLLDKKSRAKPIGTDIPIANTVLGNPSQEFSQGTIQATTAQLSSEVQTGNGIEASSKSISSERPHFESRSPSTLEVAERFVTESTKQLADWGEEAMSGVLKSTKSFSIMKATADPTEVEPAIDATTEIGLSEEEHDRNRMFDRRIIREFSSIFGTGFYFSTDFNLLTSMQKRSDFAKTASIDELPLWKQVDSRFWWNEHLLQEFLEIEAHEYILPIMQGYVEIVPCVIEEQSFEFTLISRRSRERSGLRYQRRGIDEQGNTANFVETEQLLRIVRHDSDHQVSFVQTRGSIPLFWSQSPYRLKPIPILERTEQENEEGIKKHFDSQRAQYGQQICINLVEQHGRELIAGSAYTRYIQKLSEPQIRYVEFDFHEQCKGMRYENIERLIKSLESPIQELGYCWLAPKNDNLKGGESWKRLYDQKGVIRTNCMDCLDRTNVVQSAISRHVLNHQLLRLGIASFPDQGLSVYEEFENIFNHVWANNGDAISREYAGTSALKGDFTRTGKRNLQGMINDATNSVARMYQNTFKDNFRQAAIDYLLGSVDVNVFKNLQTTAFGTAVVPPPILPPQEPIAHGASTSNLLVTDPTINNTTTGLLPSLIPQLASSSSSLPSENTDSRSEGQDNASIQQETWVKIREAAIETSAEIVISPGEEVWQGWTFVCCSNEISSSLTSASSPQSSPKPKSSSSGVQSGLTNISDSDLPSAVFYDEKIVLLTERALYICTYDYEMEKVLEFWRLALEKMTGIDKGAFFLTAQDKSPKGQNPLENYGFAIVYRANAGGETLRVNSGSVRNRRMMGIDWTQQTLDRLQEVDEDSLSSGSGLEQVDSRSSEGTSEERHIDYDDSRSAKSILRDEQKDIRSVRFKIVKHPETSVMPYVTSDSTSSHQSSMANPTGYTRTAQDCVEWVVTEIIQARCELVALSEGIPLPSGSQQPQRMSRALQTTPPGQTRGHHARSPSEEYNYQSPRSKHRSSVQVDLVIRDRVLQSLEVAEQLEKNALKLADGSDKKKKSKKTFAAFFSSSKSSSTSVGGNLLPSANNNRSWLKKFQFGQDTDDESEDDDERQSRSRQQSVPVSVTTTVSSSNTNTTVQEGQESHDGQLKTIENRRRSSSQQRNSGQSVFAKFKQAVKNL